MSEIFLYNLSPQKEMRVKMLCRRLLIGARSIEKDEYGYTLSYLLGLSQDATAKDGEDFDDEMLYITGLNGGMFHLFLDQLRREKLSVPLKAVQTDTNIGFTSFDLHRELCAEREAIAKGIQAHNG